eukprot:Rhum_TRINITY_DN14167_c0_g2::Rhum_TRINITY_DN14167_c0_g2_i2::g.69689::m.69689
MAVKKEDTASTSGKWFTPQRVAMALIAVTMWVIVIVMTVDIVNKYLSSGRKEKTSLSRVKQQRLEFPWVVVVDSVGTYCKAALNGCAFSHAAKDSLHNCNEVIYPRKLDLDGDITDTHILNQTHAREKGYVFETAMDFMMMLFVVVKDDPVLNYTYIVTNRTDCREDATTSEWMNVVLVPIADTEVMERVGQGTSKVHDFGTPVYAGLNHQSLLSFSLTQERFVDGRVVNTSSYKNTQIYISERHPQDPLGFNVIVQPDSFVVTQVNHLEGDSVITLLGSVFGWVGVLTGTSIQGLLLTVIAFRMLHASKAREKDLQEKEDALLVNEANAQFRLTEMSVQRDDASAELLATQETLRAVQRQLDDLTSFVHGGGAAEKKHVVQRPPSFLSEAQASQSQQPMGTTFNL